MPRTSPPRPAPSMPSPRSSSPLSPVADLRGPLRTSVPGMVPLWIDWDNLQANVKLSWPLPQRIALQAEGLSGQTDPADDTDPVRTVQRRQGGRPVAAERPGHRLCRQFHRSGDRCRCDRRARAAGARCQRRRHAEEWRRADRNAGEEPARPGGRNPQPRSVVGHGARHRFRTAVGRCRRPGRRRPDDQAEGPEGRGGHPGRRHTRAEERRSNRALPRSPCSATNRRCR